MSETKDPAEQIAALPLHRDAKGRLRVLLITSRDTGRWVMPKGWPMDGKKPWHAAQIEALEEAGAVGSVSDAPFGHYHYLKQLDTQTGMLCRVTVYPMMVQRLKRRWKEHKERKRHWFSPAKAARLVEEQELSALLMALSSRLERDPVLDRLRRAS